MTVTKNKKKTIIEETPFVENIIEVDLLNKAEQDYLDYSMSVVLSRALPNSNDGLKPVHRRVIYAMQQLGLLNSPNHKKSARVVGDVLGKYHPHGDSAVYESMVIQAQPFKTRYPFIDGQGNWGSMDDPKSFAAMRYTECRLTPIAESLLRDLPYDTVDFVKNFDGTEIEPSVLPTSLPINIINGSSGIAVGMSADYPSHNIVEVIDACIDYMKRPTKANLESTLNIIKGPDLPNGGQILNSEEEIKEIYMTGKGSFKVRAKYEIVHNSNKKGDFTLLFKEFTPDSSPEMVLNDIDKILNPETYMVKGKKLSPQKLKIKTVFNNLIDIMRDESADGQYVISIKNKSKDVSPEQLLSALFKNTSLQKNIRFEMLNVVNFKPSVLNIFEYIVQWAKFRMKVMTRRFEFLLRKVNARIHILEGRLLIIDNIDKAIKIIRNSEDPKIELMKSFKLSEIQAEDILNMKLGSLSRLAKLTLEEELKKLIADKLKYESLISDEKLLRKEAIKELEQDKKLFGDPRRTELYVKEEVVDDIVESLVLDKISDENIAIALSEYGWISWKSAKQLTFTENDFKFKSGDNIKQILVSNKSQSIMLIDDKGKSYSLSLNELTGRTGSEATNKWFKSSNRMIAMIISENPEEDKYLLSSSEGYGFIAKGADILTKISSGKNLITLKDKAEVLKPVFVPKYPTEKQVVVILSSADKFVAFPLSAIKEIPRGKGVALMGYGKDEKIISVGITDEIGNIKILDSNDNIVELNWKQIQKILLTDRKSTAKGKEINKMKDIKGFYFTQYDLQANIKSKEIIEENAVQEE